MTTRRKALTWLCGLAGLSVVETPVKTLTKVLHLPATDDTPETVCVAGSVLLQRWEVERGDPHVLINGKARNLAAAFECSLLEEAGKRGWLAERT